MKDKHWILILALVLVAVFLFAFLTHTRRGTVLPQQEDLVIQMEDGVIQSIGTAESTYASFSNADLETDYTDMEIISIDVQNGETITLSEGGVYTLQGTQNGQLCIDAQDQIVSLILDNVNFVSNNGPAILVQSAGKLVVTLPEGTASTITDSAYYDGYVDMEACIYAVSDITFNGTGALTVTGYAKDGIRTKEVCKIIGSEVNVFAKRNGIRASDGLIAVDARLDLQCEKNGILTSKTGVGQKGFVVLYGGELKVIAGAYGINAAGDVVTRECDTYFNGVIESIISGGDTRLQKE